MTYLKGICVALALFAVAGVARAQDYSVGSIKIGQVWTREVPPASKVAGGFMTITNTGTEPDTLVGGSLVGAGKLEVHEMAMVGGVMRMRELKPGLVIKPGEPRSCSSPAPITSCFSISKPRPRPANRSRAP